MVASRSQNFFTGKKVNLLIIWTTKIFLNFYNHLNGKFGQWEPGLADVYKGTVLWEKTSDVVEFDVTLYRGINDGEFEEKEWILMIESEDASGKRKLMATGKLNIENYASMDPQNEQSIKNFKLKIISTKIKSISLDFSISSQFIKDGKAT